MYKARKLNRVVRIPEEKFGEYKELGYSIYDPDGNVIYAPQDDKARIAELEKENRELKAEISKLKKTVKQSGVPKSKAIKEKEE